MSDRLKKLVYELEMYGYEGRDAHAKKICWEAAEAIKKKMKTALRLRAENASLRAMCGIPKGMKVPHLES